MITSSEKVSSGSDNILANTTSDACTTAVRCEPAGILDKLSYIEYFSRLWRRLNIIMKGFRGYFLKIYWHVGATWRALSSNMAALMATTRHFPRNFQQLTNGVLLLPQDYVREIGLSVLYLLFEEVIWSVRNKYDVQINISLSGNYWNYWQTRKYGV